MPSSVGVAIFVLSLFLGASFASFWGRVCAPVLKAKRQNKLREQNGKLKVQRSHHSLPDFLRTLRAGRTDHTVEVPANLTQGNGSAQHNHHHGANCHIIISTSVGSQFLDKKKRLSMSRNATIAELKQLVEKKFPGCPPRKLQKLFFGMRQLQDDEHVGNLTTMSPVPILLDMVSGTSVYNKTMSISQALEAYVSTIVQQSYLGDKLKAYYASIADGNDNLTDISTEGVEMAVYRDMFEAVNRTLFETYAEDIALALEAEKEPETDSPDTSSWRSKKKEVNPLTAELAKTFDLNLRSLRNYIYYSVIIVVFALYGTTTTQGSLMLLMMVPALWLSKVRVQRFLGKLLKYLVLPLVSNLGFIMEIMPAPLQVIATESAKWVAEEESSGGEEDDSELIDSLRSPQNKLPKTAEEALKSFKSFFSSGNGEKAGKLSLKRKLVKEKMDKGRKEEREEEEEDDEEQEEEDKDEEEKDDDDEKEEKESEEEEEEGNEEKDDEEDEDEEVEEEKEENESDSPEKSDKEEDDDDNDDNALDENEDDDEEVDNNKKENEVEAKDVEESDEVKEDEVDQVLKDAEEREEGEPAEEEEEEEGEESSDDKDDDNDDNGDNGDNGDAYEEGTEEAAQDNIEQEREEREEEETNGGEGEEEDDVSAEGEEKEGEGESGADDDDVVGDVEESAERVDDDDALDDSLASDDDFNDGGDDVDDEPADFADEDFEDEDSPADEEEIGEESGAMEDDEEEGSSSWVHSGSRNNEEGEEELNLD